MLLIVGCSQKHSPDPLPLLSAAEHLESVRPLPVEIDTRSPVRFEVYSEQGNKAVKGVVLQVRVIALHQNHPRLFFFFFPASCRPRLCPAATTQAKATACALTATST
jgi:hypothetical protein